MKNSRNKNDLCLNPMKARCQGTAKLHFALAMMFLLGMHVVSAATVTLKSNDAAGTSSFAGATNWNNGAVPSAANNYFTTNFVLRTTNTTVTGNSYTFQGNSLSIDSGGRFLGKIGGTAVATITVTNLVLNGGLFDQANANSDTSQLIVAGNVNVNAASIVGALGGTANGSSSFETLEFTAPISGSGVLQVSGPNINAGGDTGVTKLSAANPYGGTITVSNGNGNIIASTVNRILQLNNLNALSNATVNLNSSQASPVSFAAGVNLGNFNLGALAGRASQTLTDTAGSAVILNVGGNNVSSSYSGALTGNGSLTKVGSGTLTMTGANTYSGNTTITAGSLQLGNGGASGSLPNGGALTLNGNLTINRNNTVTQGTDFNSSAITGTGSFTQAGIGTTILNAANSYSGVTTINAGKLVVSSAQTGTGAITVADGAKLDVTVSGTSQLPPSTLTLGTSAATTLEFDGLNSTTIAPIDVGTLSLGGQVTVNINTGTFAAGNSYPLINWTASGPANASSFTLGVSPGLTATFLVASSTLYLNVSAVSDIWAGTVSGNWDTSTANWTGNATVFVNGQAVLFDDSATGSTTVTVNTPVQPGSIMANNSALTYTINSSGLNNIGGSGGLTKQNTGSLTLAGGANTYTGVTTINNGILSIGALANGGQSSDIGAATAASANLVLNGGTLQYTGGTVSIDRGATLGASGGTIDSTGGGVLTSSGVIVGSGTLTKTGFDTLVLSGASTFSGGVTLNSGEVDINNGGSSSANSAIGTGTLTLGVNTTIDNTSGSDVTLLPNNAQVWNGNFFYKGTANNLNLGTGAVSLPATVAVTVNANTLTVGGAISGAGGFTKLGSGTLVLSGTSTLGGTVDLQAGTLAVGNNLALGNGLLNFNGGISGSTFQSVDGTAHTITNAINFAGSANANSIFGGTGNLLFTATPAGNATAKTMTVNNPQTEFSGALGGASARTVAGTGILILSGANTYSGGTTINSGATLQLGNGGTNGLLSASGAIDDEGTLLFNHTNALVQGTHFSSAAITGAGSVVQAGSGTTTLNAANTYSGPTTVNNGELFITQVYQGGGNVFVADGAKFGVQASSVSNSATIGNLTLGSSGATTLDFSYGLTGNPTNAALVASTVTIDGNSAIRIGGAFTVGTFPVLKYGSLSGTFAGTVVGPRGVTATLSNDVVNQVLYVAVSSVGTGIVWTGTNSIAPNLWDLNTTTNWLIGVQPTDYIENVPPGDAVTFNDFGSGTVLLSNTVSPASVTISNVLVNYTIQGSGQINCLGGLTKVGAGTVTMNVPATFTGNTVVSNGTYSIGANQTFANLSGNGTVTTSTGTPVLTVNNSLNTTFSGGVSGALTLTTTGSGRLTMTGSNNISGNLFVSSGTLTFDSGFMNLNNFCSVGHVGTDNGIMTLKGTESFTDNSDFNVGDVGASVGTLNIQDTANLNINAFYIGSANSAGSMASGTVNQTGGTVTQLSNVTGTFCIGGRTTGTSTGGVGIYNLSGGTLSAVAGIRVGSVGQGTLNQSGGTVIANTDINIARIAGATGTYNLDGGTLITTRVTSSTSVNATLNLNGGVIQAMNPQSPFVGLLSAANVLAGGAIFDSATNNIVIAQQLLDGGTGGGLTKFGSGTMYLDAGNTYTGNTVISNGVLAGVGTIAGPVLVEPNGKIGAGDAGPTVGTLTINNNLTLQGGATFRINKTGGTPMSDLVSVSGTTSYSGMLIVTNITSDATPLTTNDTFQLFTASVHSGTFASIVGSPGTGLAYTFTNGVLSVVTGGVATNPTNIIVIVSGGNLNLSWPTDHIGWTLQAQTNLLVVGLGTNWVNVPGTISTNAVSFPINNLNGAVFYRLKL
jgi:fibronectin-binding autotransporter adhesin